MSMRRLYVTFNIKTPVGNGSGRTTLTISDRPGRSDMLSPGEIEKIEAYILEMDQSKKDNVTELYLTWWAWLADDEGEA